MTRTRKKFIAAILVIVMAGCWIAVAPFIADGLVAEKPLEKADAIVVLSGSAEYIDRTHEAAKAFKAGVAPKIFVTNDDHRSGWVESEKRNPYFVERAFAELVSQGVPANAIEALPGAVHGTDDEANLVVPFAVERKMRSLVLITSPYHSYRALWTFERAVAKSSASLTLGVLKPSENYRYPTRFNWWMSIYGWRSVGMEYVKFVYYWLFY
jgi:uncharacterized SAM-binding protein YcdF (DUF218 family)